MEAKVSKPPMQVPSLTGVSPATTVSITAAPKRRVRPKTLLLHSTILFFCLIAILPVAWILLVSIEPLHVFYSDQLFPRQLDLSNYAFVYDHLPDIGPYFLNSMIVTAATVVITTTCAVLAAYGLVHLRLPGRALFIAALVATLFLPGRLVSLIAIFDLHTQLHLRNTLVGLILPYVALNLVVATLFMRGVFQQISPEIVDSARIDGSSSWQTLRAVLLPMVTNGILVVVITSFVATWGEYVLVLTLNDDRSTQTLLLAVLGGVPGMGMLFFSQFAALYALFIAPGILIFALFLPRFIKGLNEGALQG